MVRTFILLTSAFVGLGGCSDVGDSKLAHGRDKADGVNSSIAKLAKLDSAGDFITIVDLDKFRPGRPKNEILTDLRWRAGYVLAARCDDKSITRIDYTLYAGSPESHPHDVLHAIFVNDRFEKFVRWETMYKQESSRDWPKRMKVGDCCGWLNRAVKSEAMSVDKLRKDEKSIKAPPKHTDPGLTALYLAMRTLGLAPGPPPREEDYEKLQKNLALRDQFNAARLNIGMTQAEVQATLKVKPLESGIVEAGNYCIYGSNESFDLNNWLSFSHFMNILVVFRDGKAVAISNIEAGYDWRRKLEKTLIDLPKRDAVTK